MGLGIFGAPVIELNINRSTNQSIPNNAATNVQWENEVVDSGELFNSAVSNTTITIPTTGLYAVTIGLSWAANVTGSRHAFLLLNGVDNVLLDRRMTVTGGLSTSLTLSGIRYFTADDTLVVQVLQNSGAALNLLGVSGNTELFLVCLSLNQP